MKKSKLLISVLMPVYNSEKYLKLSIKSIINQTYKNFEFIILDDASSDYSYNIIQQYAKNDSRIKILRNKQRMGIPYSRNRLLLASKGRFVAWQDADDISRKSRLSKQMTYLVNNPQVGIVGGYLQIIDQKGKTLHIRKYSTEDTILRKSIFHFMPVAQPSSLVRKKML